MWAGIVRNLTRESCHGRRIPTRLPLQQPSCNDLSRADPTSEKAARATLLGSPKCPQGSQCPCANLGGRRCGWRWWRCCFKFSKPQSAHL